MEECGIDIDDNIQCWCGFKSSFHHSSTSRRKDGKITMWYKCRNNHITPIDVNYKNPIQIVKKKCLHNRSVNCDIFDDTINCWYESFMNCRQAKQKREKNESL